MFNPNLTDRMMTQRQIIFSTFILLFQFMYSQLLFSEERQKFVYYTDIDGLPRNITTCIDQDSYGYIWVGTRNGLARYDGNTFIKYDQLEGTIVNCIYVDTKNNLWVGTNTGLFLYNRITNFFEQRSYGYILNIQEDKEEIYSLHAGLIQKNSTSGNKTVKIEDDFINFCITEEGIWQSTKKSGAKLLSRKSEFQSVSENILRGYLVSVISSINDNLFFGCQNGQLFVKKTDGTLKNIVLDNHHKLNKIVQIDNEIWLATDGNGIIVLDADLNYLRTLKRGQNNDQSLRSNSIYDIFKGINHKIWVASFGAGLTCILHENLLFTNIIPEKGNPNSLVASEGISVFEQNGLTFLGTNYGMSILDERKMIFKNFSTDQLQRDLGGVKVHGICTDSEKNLWIGTYDGLLGKYSSTFRFLKSFHPCSDTPNEMQKIVMMYNYNNTNLLIGTQFQDRSLLNFDLKTEKVYTLGMMVDSIKVNHFQINSIRKNQKGEILILDSKTGLHKVNFKENKLENCFQELNKRISFWLNDFYNDKSENYWFTTRNDGLIKVSADGKQFKQWTIKDGFLTNSLIRIESVDDQFLWISSIAGLCRFEMKTGQILNFNHRDGLPANEFTDRNSAKTEDGRIIFGSVAGFTIVNPSNLVSNTSKPEVIISDISFQNKSILSPEGRQFLTVPLEETKKITFPYDRNSFTVHFFTRSKDFPEYNNYSYRMIGLESGWTFLGETNHINYTNLSPGTYVFEVKNASKTNIDDTPHTKLIIRINPPWYLSWYAITGYILLLFTLIYMSLKIYNNRVQLKKELEISEYKVQKEHELTEKKLAFFTSISHDLKTPLTLIDAPVSDLLRSENLNPEQVNKLMLIRRNSTRLYKLITDLLDFRKLTQKQLALEVNETNIHNLIDEIALVFNEECKNKSVNFEKKVLIDHPVFVDSGKIEKILWNLLSNAIKFTESGGLIQLGAELKIQNEREFLELIVSDTGIGISESDQTKIFDPFYQVRNSRTNSQKGTGIGLSIVKDLVELHHGEIQLDSRLDAGTSFRIVIPATRDQYLSEEISFSSYQPNTKPEPGQNIATEAEASTGTKQNRYNIPKLLIVEDNDELRHYLAGHFEDRYTVYQAEDGRKGLQTAGDVNPDLILTDVQMPNMNGYEFCNEIRHNFDTSHIPVVMLTANSTNEQQIEGISTGADAYVTKPFNMELLDTILHSVLENRKKLRYKLLGVDKAFEDEQLLPQKDIDFIAELKSFIENNMVNPDLNVDMIANHFAVSRTQLNRKIKSLTGSTPNNLIKTIRLKKAYELIRQEGARVSEVAYQTGFSDPNYFTYCFKREFGENPSQI